MNRSFIFKSSFIRVIGSLIYIVLKYVVSLLIYYYVFDFDWIKTPIVYIPISIFTLIDLFPALLIWVQYLTQSFSSRFKFDFVERRIDVIESNKVTSYEISDIKSIEYVFSYGGDTGIYAFGEFYYWKFGLKSGECVLLTNFSCTKKIYSEFFDSEFPKPYPSPKLYPFLPAE